MPFGSTKYTTLSIRGAPDIEGTATLSLNYSVAVSGNPTLFMAGPPSLSMPLVIVANPSDSGDASLYVSGTEGTGTGADDYQGYGTLVLKGRVGVYDSTNFTLFIETNRIGSGINTSPLYLAGDTPNSINEGATIAVSGGVVSGPGSDSQTATLLIDSSLETSESIPLFIDKGFNTSHSATLYINNRMASGHMPVVVKGGHIKSGNVSLFIAPPASGNITLYTRGYLE
mgnify:CR=1 FL=1